MSKVLSFFLLLTDQWGNPLSTVVGVFQFFPNREAQRREFNSERFKELVKKAKK